MAADGGGRSARRAVSPKDLDAPRTFVGDDNETAKSKLRGLPAHAILARQLGVAIVTGRHRPGDLLPRELETAGRLQVSRSVVREAQRMLSAKGLVESRPKVGTWVRERHHWNMLDPDLLGWMFEGAPPISFVRNLFDLRLIVEPAAAEFAARKRTSTQLARMGRALDEMAHFGLGSERGRDADQQFHATLLEATGNEVLVSLSAGIAAAVRWTTHFKFTRSLSPRDPIDEHRVLFDTIAIQNAAAAKDATISLVRQALADTELLLPDPAADSQATSSTDT